MIEGPALLTSGVIIHLLNEAGFCSFSRAASALGSRLYESAQTIASTLLRNATELKCNGSALACLSPSTPGWVNLSPAVLVNRAIALIQDQQPAAAEAAAADALVVSSDSSPEAPRDIAGRLRYPVGPNPASNLLAQLQRRASTEVGRQQQRQAAAAGGAAAGAPPAAQTHARRLPRSLQAPPPPGAFVDLTEVVLSSCSQSFPTRHWRPIRQQVRTRSHPSTEHLRSSTVREGC